MIIRRGNRGVLFPRQVKHKTIGGGAEIQRRSSQGNTPRHYGRNQRPKWTQGGPMKKKGVLWQVSKGGTRWPIHCPWFAPTRVRPGARREGYRAEQECYIVKRFLPPPPLLLLLLFFWSNLLKFVYFHHKINLRFWKLLEANRKPEQTTMVQRRLQARKWTD